MFFSYKWVVPKMKTRGTIAADLERISEYVGSGENRLRIGFERLANLESRRGLSTTGSTRFREQYVVIMSLMILCC